MRLIDADALIEFIDMGHLRNPLESCFSERDVVDMLESRPTIEQPQWISCAERLPDEHVDVQMCWKTNGTQATGFYMDESWYTYAEDGYYTDCEKAPTHWKAVGEPPKGDE